MLLYADEGLGRETAPGLFFALCQRMTSRARRGSVMFVGNIGANSKVLVIANSANGCRVNKPAQLTGKENRHEY
jgi:hypothetical protein